MGRRFLLGLLAMLALCGATAAGPPPPRLMPLDVDTLVMPAGGPLKFKTFDKSEITAHFAGRVTLAGTYRYGYNETADDWSVTLMLDAASRRLLPYWKNRPGDGTLWIDNEADFVRAVIPRATIDKLRAKKSGSISGHVAIVAEDYKAAIVCDAPDYSVRFISLATMNVAQLSPAPAEFGC